jgi:hypothetical protein
MAASEKSTLAVPKDRSNSQAIGDRRPDSSAFGDAEGIKAARSPATTPDCGSVRGPVRSAAFLRMRTASSFLTVGRATRRLGVWGFGAGGGAASATAGGGLTTGGGAGGGLGAGDASTGGGGVGAGAGAGDGGFGRGGGSGFGVGIGAGVGTAEVTIGPVGGGAS